eukprot:m.18608 g.18608  ORF g.18608 m.18608 type:complete len:263 (-) comp8334_c0_seq2:2384-3172(-)
MSTTTTIGVTTVGDAGGFSFSLSSGLAVTAAKTVGSVFLIFIVGILASWFPSHPSKSVHLSGILPQSSIRNVAKLCTNILIPCLGFVSLGSTLTIDIIKEAWPMVIWTPVHMIACGIVATILYKVACLPQKYFTEFCVGCVFTNVVSMPLVMLEVLCAQEEVDEGANCFERAASFVFLPVMSWIFIFWTIGLSTIRYIRVSQTIMETDCYELINVFVFSFVLKDRYNASCKESGFVIVKSSSYSKYISTDCGSYPPSSTHFV